MREKKKGLELEQFSRMTAGYIEIVETRLAALQAAPNTRLQASDLQETLDRLEHLRESLLNATAAGDAQTPELGEEGMTAGEILPRYVEPDLAKRQFYVEPDLDSEETGYVEPDFD